MRNNVFIPIVLLLSILTQTGASYAAITGPESADAGQIAVFSSDVEAAWAVIPESYSASVYIDSSSKTLIFASPDAGRVTVVAGTVVDGKPVLDTKVFYNGIDGPSPTPAPNPEPEPDPNDLKSVASSAADAVKSDTADEERSAVVASLESVVDGISRGTIRDAAGARATLRKVWLSKASAIGTKSAVAWQPFFDAIAPLIEPTELSNLKTDFQTVISSISTTESPSAVKRPPATSGCSTGQCPTTRRAK